MKKLNTVSAVFLFLFCGCVNFRYHISENDKAWFPYQTKKIYVLKEDVFLMKVDSGLEPERPALVPPSDSVRGSGFHSSPASIRAYCENPDKASRKKSGDSYHEIDVIGVVNTGTEFIPYKIMRNAGWNLWFGNHTHDTLYAKIINGPYSGMIADIEDISWCLKGASDLNRYVKKKVAD